MKTDGSVRACKRRAIERIRSSMTSSQAHCEREEEHAGKRLRISQKRTGQFTLGNFQREISDESWCMKESQEDSDGTAWKSEQVVPELPSDYCGKKCKFCYWKKRSHCGNSDLGCSQCLKLQKFEDQQLAAKILPCDEDNYEKQQFFEDQWTAEQEKQLRRGISQNLHSSISGLEVWQKISKKVSEKTVEQCVQKYFSGISENQQQQNEKLRIPRKYKQIISNENNIKFPASKNNSYVFRTVKDKLQKQSLAKDFGVFSNDPGQRQNAVQQLVRKINNQQTISEIKKFQSNTNQENNQLQQIQKQQKYLRKNKSEKNQLNFQLNDILKNHNKYDNFFQEEDDEEEQEEGVFSVESE